LRHPKGTSPWVSRIFASCPLAVDVAAAFKTLDQGKYALELNWSNQKIGETV